MFGWKQEIFVCMNDFVFFQNQFFFSEQNKDGGNNAEGTHKIKSDKKSIGKALSIKADNKHGQSQHQNA